MHSVRTNILPSWCQGKPLYTLLHSQALGKLLLHALCAIRCDMAVDGGDAVFLRSVYDHSVDQEAVELISKCYLEVKQYIMGTTAGALHNTMIIWLNGLFRPWG